MAEPAAATPAITPAAASVPTAAASSREGDAAATGPSGQLQQELHAATSEMLAKITALETELASAKASASASPSEAFDIGAYRAERLAATPPNIIECAEAGEGGSQEACHLPAAVEGVPVVGELREGAFVGYGHGCWGILLAPATGEALANQIATGASPFLDLGRFDPRRF